MSCCDMAKIVQELCELSWRMSGLSESTERALRTGRYDPGTSAGINRMSGSNQWGLLILQLNKSPLGLGNQLCT